MEAIPKDLVYISDEAPGYTRVKKGKGFCYCDESGQKVASSEVLARVKSLCIPPIWKKVWIAKDEHGHLQATGYDPKERSQIC